MAHALYYPLLTTSITIASILTGCQLSLSFVSIPSILALPNTNEHALLTMFRTAFNRDFYLCPTQAMLSSFLFVVNAALTFFSEGGEQGVPKSSLNLLVAGILAIALVPYTLTVIVPVEEPLLKRQSALAKQRGGRKDTLAKSEFTVSRKMIEEWVVQNYRRTVLPCLSVLWAWWMCR